MAVVITSLVFLNVAVEIIFGTILLVGIIEAVTLGIKFLQIKLKKK
jgi:hypothetical protein